MSNPVRSIGSVLERKKKENTIHHIGKTNHTTNACTFGIGVNLNMLWKQLSLTTRVYPRLTQNNKQLKTTINIFQKTNNPTRFQKNQSTEKQIILLQRNQ